MSRAEPDVVYLSPRGKRCALVVAGRPRPWLEFRYLDHAALAGGGFYLRHEQFLGVMRIATTKALVSAAIAGQK